MTEMMRFIDVRGDEKITYRVARISYSDGTSLVWLADNLRTTKYPDGTDIESNNYKNTPESFGEGRVKAYGVHYHYDIRDKIALRVGAYRLCRSIRTCLPKREQLKVNGMF